MCENFSKLTHAKIKVGVCNGAQIRSLITDEKFDATITEFEAWQAFRIVVNNFLGNHNKPDYKNILANLLIKYHILGCNISIKFHFLHLHLDFFRVTTVIIVYINI